MARRPRFTPEQYRQRPSDLDLSLADRIVERISNGEMLTDICDDIDMPLPGTFLRWCDQDPLLTERHRDARRHGADVNFDEAVSVAYGDDSRSANVRSLALFRHVERSLPEKYGPRAIVKTPAPGDDAGGGIDHSAEVRRKLETMAQRARAAREALEAGPT